MVLLDKTDGVGATYEAIVNITEGRVTSWRHVEGVQPGIMLEEFFACQEAVKAHPDFQAALARRGITNLDLVYVDPWSAGNYGTAEENTRRILRTTVHMRLNPEDPEENSYAHPVAGLHALFDLNTMEVIRVDDYGVIPVPQQYGNYTKDAVGPLRSDLKAIEITQPEGPSFSVNGHEVSWQKWRFPVWFFSRAGRTPPLPPFEGQGGAPPVLPRAAPSPLVAASCGPTPPRRRPH